MSPDPDRRTAPAPSDPESAGALGRWWDRVQWPVIWLAAAVAFVLGVIGFSRRPEYQGEGWDVVDWAYLSLQLFVLQSGGLAKPPPDGLLNWARFLAPGVTVYTAVRALLVLFRDQLTWLRIRFRRGHVIVLGLGRTGRLLALQFRVERKVVGVERDPANEWLGRAPGRRTLVVAGRATERPFLERLRPERARYLFAVTGDDEANIEFALRVRERWGQTRQRRPLDCYVHVVDPRLAALLLESEVGRAGPEPVRIEFFSLFDAGARAMLEELTEVRARLGEREPLRQLIVVGLGRLGEHVVTHAARGQWVDPAAAPMRLTVVDRSATARLGALTRRFPRLGERCRVDPVDLEIEEPAFEQADFVDASAPPGTVAACVCVDDDGLALAGGLLLSRRLRAHGNPVLVRCTSESGFGAALVAARHEGVTAFDLLARTCRKDTILLGVRETLAQALHADYLESQRRLGVTPAVNPAMVSWDELPEHLRESNRRQASHLAAKLDAVRCALTAQVDWAEPPLQFTPAEVELLAEMEHRRWREEREAEGWRWAKEKSLEDKRSPYLVDWAILPEPIVEANRATIRALPVVLARVGFRIYRLPKAMQEDAKPGMEDREPLSETFGRSR